MKMMELTNRIKLARGEKRLTQADMAEKLGITPSFYHKMESRGRKLSIEQVEKIAGALGMSYIELLTYGDKGTNDKLESEDTSKRIEELESRIKDKEEIINYLRFRAESYEKLTNRIAEATLNYLLRDTAFELKIGKFYEVDFGFKLTGKTVDWLDSHTFDDMKRSFPDYHLMLTEEEKRNIIRKLFEKTSEKNRLAKILLRSGIVPDSGDKDIWIEEFNRPLLDNFKTAMNMFSPFDDVLQKRFKGNLSEK